VWSKCDLGWKGLGVDRAGRDVGILAGTGQGVMLALPLNAGWGGKARNGRATLVTWIEDTIWLRRQAIDSRKKI